MKIDNLHQEHDAPAPYADSLVIDAGGVDAYYGGEAVAHISFEGLDPFEIAFHALPDDWEPHDELTDTDTGFNTLTVEQHCENGINGMLRELGKLRGWERQ